MLLRANNKREELFCSPCKTFTVKKNFWYVRHNPLLIFLYYPVHNALLDVWKKRETANHVGKKFARFIRYKNICCAMCFWRKLLFNWNTSAITTVEVKDVCQYWRTHNTRAQLRPAKYKIRLEFRKEGNFSCRWT